MPPFLDWGFATPTQNSNCYYGLQISPLHSQGPSEQKLIKNSGKRERGRIQGLPIFLCTPNYLRNGYSYELNILYAHSQEDRSDQKPIKNSRKSSRQGLPKIFRTPIYRAHLAVIFATAQISCFIAMTLSTMAEKLACLWPS